MLRPTDGREIVVFAEIRPGVPPGSPAVLKRWACLRLAPYPPLGGVLPGRPTRLLFGDSHTG
jgi:hypothetical protein